MINCRLKGCNAKFINEQVKCVLQDEDILDHIKSKSIQILKSYSIIDCMKIITKFGDIHNAFLKYDRMIDVNDDDDEEGNKIKLYFHRNLTYSYIYKIIRCKIDNKVHKFRVKHILKTAEKHNCPICLCDIKPKGMFVSRCGHVYHYNCVRTWGMDQPCHYCMRQV